MKNFYLYKLQQKQMDEADNYYYQQKRELKKRIKKVKKKVFPVPYNISSWWDCLTEMDKNNILLNYNSLQTNDDNRLERVYKNKDHFWKKMYETFYDKANLSDMRKSKIEKLL